MPLAGNIGNVGTQGRATQLIVQAEDTFRTRPASPSAVNLDILEGASITDTAGYDANPVMTNTALGEKLSCSDEAWTFDLPVPMDLNQIGWWYTFLLGNATSVDNGDGTYTHTWTVSLDPRPSFFAQMMFGTNPKTYRQWVGGGASSMEFGIREGDGKATLSGLFAAAWRDGSGNHPTADFDSTPVEYAANMACRKFGTIVNIENGNTLGQIVSSTVSINNDMEGFSTGDDAYDGGYGSILLGDFSISGRARILLFDGLAQQFAEQHTSFPLVMGVSNHDKTAQLKINLPACEFGKPVYEIASAKALIQDYEWRAHSSDTAPTIELTNGVAGYV